MRCNMSNVAVIAVAAAALVLMTAETVAADGGSGGSGSGGGGGGGGGSGGEQQRGATAAAAADRQDMTNDDNSPRTPSAVQCTSCLAHEGIKSLSIELIKASILNKLGMQRPPEFGDRRPPKVPTDLPPLQDLMKKYNTDRDGSVVVLPHIRHKTSRHYEAPSGVAEMQSDEAATAASENTSNNNSNNNNNNNNNYYSGGNGGGGDDEEDDYHLKTHKLIAFAQIHPTTPKNRGHYLLYFTFSEQTGQHRITEAILWVYKKKSELVIDDPVIIIEVYRINPVTLHQTKVSYIKRVINTTEPGWVPIDLRTKKMADWFRAKDGAKNLTLAVHACYVNNNMTHVKTPYVTDARKRDDMTEIPYLEVHTEDARRSRSKRNVLGLDCNENSKEPMCCRYPLEVDFEAFGWDWIIAPKRYEANYCSGECPMVFLQRYPHTYLTQMVNQLDNKTAAYSGTGPCCSPRKLSAISMLYFDQDYNIVYGVLPGMVVDRCGCM